MTLQSHPLADIFPMMDEPSAAELLADVLANDIREQIVLFDGKILDGRNRYRAGLAAGLIHEEDGADRTRYFVRFVPEVDGDPLRFVISKNLKRRHLTDDQRRMIAGRLVSAQPGRPASGETPAECGLKISEAAALINSDAAGTERARTVLNKAEPVIINAVDRGKLSVNAAVQAASLKPEIQEKIAQEAIAGRTNVVRTVLKQERRAEREQELADKIIKAPEGKFGVVVEDYEWDHETWSEAGKDRHAGNHYPVSRDAHTAEEIVARTADRFACAADDCVLYMWTTIPHMAIAIDVLRLRGFTYKSHHAWVKDHFITGYWCRGQHEILLIGTKGSVVAPAPGTQESSVIRAPSGIHSEKPEGIMRMIERLFPNTPKLELNARKARAGWTVWGLDAPTDAEGNALDHDPDTGEITDAPPSSPAPMTAPQEAQARCQPESTFIPAPTDDELEIPPFLRRPLKGEEGRVER